MVKTYRPLIRGYFRFALIWHYFAFVAGLLLALVALADSLFGIGLGMSWPLVPAGLLLAGIALFILRLIPRIEAVVLEANSAADLRAGIKSLLRIKARHVPCLKIVTAVMKVFLAVYIAVALAISLAALADLVFDFAFETEWAAFPIGIVFALFGVAGIKLVRWLEREVEVLADAPHSPP